MLLRKDLILVNQEFSTQEEALRTLGARFVETGVAKPSFPQAVIDRELVYPTGLPAEACPIAISHCDSEHVLTSAIGAAVLASPVEFQIMGGMEGGPLQVSIIFMLAIKDPKAQVPTLKKMMALIQNRELLLGVRAAQDAEEVYSLIAPALAE